LISSGGTGGAAISVGAEEDSTACD